MRSGSETIAGLASALAKAQAELVNPAKTLTGRVERPGTGRAGQTYRYAPLSAGLEIVRRTLSRHELAVLQTTHVERESGLVVLTTTLAHGSGEWAAASWPVCRVEDMANPQAMGAALTYARRYGLFTLVGIAGEDDLDAPGDVMADAGGRAKPAERDAEVDPTVHRAPIASALPGATGVDESEWAITQIHVAEQVMRIGEEGPGSPVDPTGIRARRRLASEQRRGSPRERRPGAVPPRLAPAFTPGVADAATDSAADEVWLVNAARMLSARAGLTPEERAKADEAFLQEATARGVGADRLTSFPGPDTLAAPSPPLSSPVAGDAHAAPSSPFHVT